MMNKSESFIWGWRRTQGRRWRKKLGVCGSL